jgi:hypothetical protein
MSRYQTELWKQWAYVAHGGLCRNILYFETLYRLAKRFHWQRNDGD